MKLIPSIISLHLLLAIVPSASHDYADALSKCILFFEGQRSGFLPGDQRLSWRANSGLSDGWTYNADLTGGYYDAGDNVKFGFPMAFTTTLLAWSVIEFGDTMPPAELRNSLVAIRWATDYLLKTVSQPNRIFVQPTKQLGASPAIARRATRGDQRISQVWLAERCHLTAGGACLDTVAGDQKKNNCGKSPKVCRSSLSNSPTPPRKKRKGK